MLDVSTIIVFMAIIHSLCAILLIILWIQNRRRYRGTGFWALNMGLTSAGLLLIVMCNVVPFWMATVFATTMVIAGAVTLYAGMEIFLGENPRQHHNIILIVLYILLYSYYAFVEPSLAKRILVFSFFWLVICLQNVWLMFIRIKPLFRGLILNTGIALSFYLVINAARIISHFVYPNPKENYLNSGLFEAVVLISFQMASIILTYSLSLMVNKRLGMDIEAQEEKYSKVFHSAPYAVLLIGEPDGRIFEANDGFTALSGYSISEAIGKTTLELKLHFKEETRDDLLREVDKKGKIRGKELQFRRKCGEMMTGLFSADLISIKDRNCLITSISDITERKLAEEEREKIIGELKDAISEIKTLSGMLPICASCKKIRNDSGYWQQIESYLMEHSGAEFSHSLCPDCIRRLYPDLADSIVKKEKDHSRHE